ncbi:uncharacterized protein LOC121589631 [Anopheles merus]|uniref:uncharacterized protein LOC121589631 n=1 Tax=Anopheles merus TaxID=30066 RepID=UPI001BE407CA|nr:uncharacterized protein LOC121589631 [Anopheles merus]
MNMADKRKTTNKSQFERLISLIEQNSDVVGDRSKGSTAFWEEVSNQLNLLGPPMKDGSGWKKVWADYKSGLKKKLAHNNREYRATGGGPCNLSSFSMMEKHVIELLDLRQSIVGTPDLPMLGVDSLQYEPQPGPSSQLQKQPQQQKQSQQNPQQQQLTSEVLLNYSC